MEIISSILSRIPLRLDHLVLWRLIFHRFKSRFKVINGCRIHYVIKEGKVDLPWVVFVHGYSANAMHWHEVLLKVAATKQTVVALDLPGHGFSEEYPSPLSFEALYEMTETFLQELPPKTICLIGNSLGGALSLKFAMAHPERIRSAVLISPAGTFESPEEWQRLKKILTVRTVNEAILFVKKIFHRIPWYFPLIIPTAMHNLRRPGISQFLNSVENTPKEFFATHVNKPTLLIWGQDDQLLPKAQLNWYKNHFAKSIQFEEPNDIGHCPQLDSANWLSQRILDYLSTA